MLLTKSVEFVMEPPKVINEEMSVLLSFAGGAGGEDKEEPIVESNDKLHSIASDPQDTTSSSRPSRVPTSGSSSGASKRSVLGMTAKSRATVLHLSLLFATDSFAGGLVTGTLLAYFFQVGGQSFSTPEKYFQKAEIYYTVVRYQI